MKKGYAAPPAVRQLAEDLIVKEYKPARVRAVVKRVFGENVSVATIKRWRTQLGERSPEAFSLADLGVKMELQEQDISSLYSTCTKSLLDFIQRYPGLDTEDYIKAMGIYFLGYQCKWPDVMELSEEFCRRKVRGQQKPPTK